MICNLYEKILGQQTAWWYGLRELSAMNYIQIDPKSTRPQSQIGLKSNRSQYSVLCICLFSIFKYDHYLNRIWTDACTRSWSHPVHTNHSSILPRIKLVRPASVIEMLGKSKHM